MQSRHLPIVAWGLSALVLTLAFIAWAQSFEWDIFPLTGYHIFPVLGLIAFSLMWTHYIMGAIRRLYGLDRSTIKKYFEVTSWVVLFSLLLHPTIMIVQLYNDGLGLPPQSYLTVYATMKVAIIVGIASWWAFLAFELRHKFGKKPWWKYVSYASDVAMIAILYHSLTLGSQLQGGWYRAVWFFYGVTLIAAIAYIRSAEFRAKKVGRAG